MQLLLYFIFLFFTGLFYITPFWLLYRISDILYFLMFYVFKYRKKVVLKNLSNSFSHKSKEEIDEISKGFYKNLCDILLEGIKGFSMSKASIIKRHKVLHPEIINEYYHQGKSVIVLTAHYTNWEWGAYSGGLQVLHPNIAFYKPLTNVYIDKYMQKRRAKCNTRLVPIYVTAKSFEENKNQVCAYLMAADQSPSNVKKAYWILFLNQDTACLHGPEKYAKMLNLPVLYLDIQRVRRGFYELETSILTEQPLEQKESGITEMYMRKLESIILAKPENWLWSHKRWKKTRIKPLDTSVQ